MLSLRMTLILLGALLIAGLYMWEQRRRRNAHRAQAGAATRHEIAPPSTAPAPPVPPEDGPSHIVTLHILAPAGQPFRGADILTAADNAGLVLGARRIFHRMSGEGADARVLFSLASMHEPGSFDLEHMETYTTSGLVIFACLPGAADGLTLYEDMLDQARQLAQVLGGEVCDERRSVLTLQTIEHTREQIRDFNRRLLLAQKQ